MTDFPLPAPQVIFHVTDNLASADSLAEHFYTSCQVYDDYSTGRKVLVIMRADDLAASVVGISDTWPVAVTHQHGGLHPASPDCKSAAEFMHEYEAHNHASDTASFKHALGMALTIARVFKADHPAFSA